MDKSIEENKIGIIREFVMPVKSKVTGNNIVSEKIRIEKDGQIKEAEVILSFIAGEDCKPFVAYSLEDTSIKDDDYKATVEIGEVTIDGEELSLSSPSIEDHRNIVVPAIVAIGNSNLYDPDEVRKNVRETIGDPKFDIIPLTSVDKYVGNYEVNNEENIFCKIKSTISVLIPVVKLKIIKKIYIAQVNKMYAQAVLDRDKNLTTEEISKLLETNDKKYDQVSELIGNFEKLPNSEEYNEDINQLVDLQEALNDAKDIYDQKYDESLKNEESVSEPQVFENNDDEKQDVSEQNEIIVEDPNEIIVEDPTIVEDRINVVNDVMKKEKEGEKSMNEMIDKNADVINLTKQLELTSKFDNEEEKLRAIVDGRVSEFNNEMVTFKDSLTKQYSEKYSREQSATVRAIKTTYEEYINSLRSTFTDLLDECILKANTSVNDLANANANLQNSLEITEKCLEDEKKENDNLRKTINGKDSEINDLRAKNEEYDKKNDEQQTRIDSLEKDNKEKDEKITALDTESKKQIAENSKLSADLRAKDSRINELNANLEKAEEQNNSYKEQLDTMSKNMDEVRSEYREYKISSEAQIAKLKAQLDSYNNFMNNIKSLHESMNGIAEVYSSESDEKTK